MAITTGGEPAVMIIYHHRFVLPTGGD